jgi:hypothetical protein
LVKRKGANIEKLLHVVQANFFTQPVEELEIGQKARMY